MPPDDTDASVARRHMTFVARCGIVLRQARSRSPQSLSKARRRIYGAGKRIVPIVRGDTVSAEGDTTIAILTANVPRRHTIVIATIVILGGCARDESPNYARGRGL